MNAEQLKEITQTLKTPTDYFEGVRYPENRRLNNVLLYSRSRLDELQQNSLENLSHYRYVLFLCLETSGIVSIDDYQIPIYPLQGALVMPYQFHTFYDLESEDLNWLFLTFEYSDESRLESLRNCKSQFTPKQLSYWSLCVQSLLDSTTAMSELELLSYAGLLIESLLHEQSEHSSFAGGAVLRGSLIGQINRILFEELPDGVSIDGIADTIGRSERSLRMNFKEEYGISLGGYIQKFKLNRAVQMLLKSDMNVGQIARATGFGSSEAFNRFFKSHMSQSPKRYALEVRSQSYT